ncbi:hypothetical protein GVN21_20105 [Caulobacter sp. SLTY]|uniref:hypothetical protein n=1 Tax=Caulobacter sp. SLTY TaxID=2683262 RepID=UPI0014121BD3|nr:hypothetical protein [Caulobacter sp. SLTY]NBB17670.1 hypothetical protein [Caulobacter sp. SLTY]
MRHEKLELDIDDLLLDLENPRTGQVDSQANALRAVISLSGRNFRNMMRSIKDHGLDPGDAFYLIQDEDSDGGFTVVDGNRRLAALKVLKNPLLLKGTSLSDTIIRPLAKEAENFTFAPDFTVDCVLFEGRPEARDWIERRHGRGMDGEGRIHWGALEIQRFQNDRTVIDVLQFVEKNSTFSEAEWYRIRTAVEKNTSSLKRFLDSKAGRQFLGFSVADKTQGPTFSTDPLFEIESLSQIFSDIADGEINTRNYNKASDIEEYFENLKSSIKTKPDKGSKLHPFSTTLVKDSKDRPRQKAKASSNPAPKTKKVAPLRSTLAPSRHAFAIPDGEKGKQLLRESSKLRLKDTPLSCAFCFRAMIEYSVDTYMRRNNISPIQSGKELTLQARLEAIIPDIYSKGLAQKGDLTPIKATLTAKVGAMSVGALNGYVHSKWQMPTSDDLRVAWDHAVPLFAAIFGPAK